MVCDHGTKSFELCRCSRRWRCKCLIPRTKKPQPPFNSTVKLEAKLGFHPKLFGTVSKSPPVGIYNPNPSRNKRSVISWQREEEVKEFASTMGGHLLEKYVVQRNLMKTGRGPGTHEIIQWPESFLKKSCCDREHMTFGTVSRFKKDSKFATPGPGYTGKEHNPYYHVDQNRFKSYTHVPSFEYDGLQSRFRETLRNWSLPCNRYNVVHPDSLSSRLKKVTGKRGPYDLFTGPRDNTNMNGYLASPVVIDHKDWPKALPGGIEKLFNKSNYFKGLWTDCPRFPKKPSARIMLNDISLCYKDPNHPGPGHYDPQLPSKVKNAMKCPFNSSVLNVRPLRPKEICPGPGRYEIKHSKYIQGQGWTWVFKSKIPRTFGSYLPKPYNSF